jgi:serine/threonine protein kinase
MFDAEGNMKLTDFGCATFIQVNDDHGRLRNFAGTLSLAPPEWLTSGEYHAEPITVWQLGSLLFNMLCGGIPFQTDSQIISGSIVWSRGVSDASRSLVDDCLKKAPAERPTLMQIAEHAWLRQTTLSN